jgi:N-methylhydantoinase A
VITVDMGGTSFDITLTKDGQTNLNKNIDFLRYRIGVPMIQVETLGAGGGSIGWIDELGIMQMGRSRRAPTPARPAMARAARADDLGRQPGARLPEPRRPARRQAAARPRQGAQGDEDEGRRSARPERRAAAYGMFTIVNNNMVNGIRRVSVERGYDPRDFVLVGAGGATAAHITALAARWASTPSSCRSSPRGSAPLARSSRT